MKKPFLLLLLAGAAASTASILSAASNSFQDDFARADSFDVGAGWTPLVGEWFIQDEALRMEDNADPQNKLIAYDAIPLHAPYEIEADLWARSGSRWGGLAFHIQDIEHFYAFRIRFAHDPSEANFQLLRFSSGSLKILSEGSIPVTGDMLDPIGRQFRVRVASQQEGTYELAVFDVNQPETPLVEITETDGAFTGGSAGVYAGAERVVFERFAVSAAQPQWEQSYRDLFTRDDSTNIGPGWNEVVGDWIISNNWARSSATANEILAYDPILLGDSFRVEGEAGSTTGSRWLGIVFNLQDGQNGYILRAKYTHDPQDAQFQFLKMEAGGLSRLASGSIPVTEDMVIWSENPGYKGYRFVVTSPAPGEFDIEIFHTDDRTTPLVSIHHSDSSFSGGTAGFFANGTTGVFDDFFVGTGALASGGGYSAWIESFNVPADLRGPEDDASGDGISNLMNYVLGTDPTGQNRHALPNVGFHRPAGEEHPALSFTYVDGLEDVELIFEVSDDLVTWTEHPLAGYPHQETTSAGEGLVSVTVWDERSLPQSGSRWFGRIRARLLN